MDNFPRQIQADNDDASTEFASVCCIVGDYISQRILVNLLKTQYKHVLVLSAEGNKTEEHDARLRIVR